MKTNLYILVLLGISSCVNAATIYQTDGHDMGESWNTAAKWSDGLAPSNINAYVNDLGDKTRTPGEGGTFAGESLTLSNGSSLTLKNGGSFTSVNLVMHDGTSMANGGGGTAKLDGSLSGSGAIELNTSYASRTIQLDVLMVPGNTIASVGIVGEGTVSIENSANTFSGVWNVEAGTLKGDGFGDGDFNVSSNGMLDFDGNHFSTSSVLVVENGGTLLLDQNVVLYSAELRGVALPLGTHFCSDLKAHPTYGAAIDPASPDSATLTVTLGSIESLTKLEAEEMTLTGYAAEANVDASGGQLVRLTGSEGSAEGLLIGFEDGYYDLKVGYFDETDGRAAFKVYLNDQLLDSWLADRRLGSSDPASINVMERTIRRVYLSSGDRIEVFGQADGGEGASIDYVRFVEAPAAVADNYMIWASDGSITNLVLNGIEHLDASEESGAIQRHFNGWTVSSSTMVMKDIRDSIVDLEYPFTTWKKHIRCIFRMDAHEHHVALRLLDVAGIPKDDPSRSIRVEIPFLSSLGYQALDTNIAASVSSGTLLIDWPHLAARNLIAGGQIALYATADAAAAQAEIEQLYTDNGKLDPYYDWIDTFPNLGNSDLFADPDGDGLNNLTEYALGGVPTLGNDGVDPSHAVAGDDFEIQYNRRRDAASRGLTYTVKATDDLGDGMWSTDGISDAGSGIIDTDFESVTNTVPTLGTTNQFLKLEIGIEK
ncbi:hypothetical protein PDESU_02410 [Pontiella desulfatans]|uniref:Uncharacterized protein n=1 Tax=Pontiella desulfatans TaxID=2750659 RepID=A0A6C2U1T9_PONDE|nr:hypothetical protein [Pontiella desulfatans]VGO13853.1 hypothetical protein PDESU_02410 [Pontiella desulfatans]